MKPCCIFISQKDKRSHSSIVTFSFSFSNPFESLIFFIRIVSMKMRISLIHFGKFVQHHFKKHHCVLKITNMSCSKCQIINTQSELSMVKNPVGEHWRRSQFRIQRQEEWMFVSSHKDGLPTLSLE